MSKLRSIYDLPVGEETISNGFQFDRESIQAAAEAHQVRPNNICCMCLREIRMQIFKNTGVCCEQHRKDRDNDHMPFRGTA